jgi:hypothetical protein
VDRKRKRRISRIYEKVEGRMINELKRYKERSVKRVKGKESEIEGSLKNLVYLKSYEGMKRLREEF